MVYEEVSMWAARDALVQRFLDVYWDQFREIFNDPEVKAAEVALARAITKAMTPGRNGKRLKACGR